MNNPTTPLTNLDPTNLGLTDVSASGGCCGGGGCACGSAETTTEASATDTDVTAGLNAGLIATDLAVTGMTCGHCVSSVTEELSDIAGVESVQVQLNTGGASTVTVTSRAAIDPATLEAAVTVAGYALAEA